MSDKEFYEKQSKLEAFKEDLKSVFEKHKVVLEKDFELWHGGSKEIIQVHVDGEHFLYYYFEELLTEIEVLQ